MLILTCTYHLWSTELWLWIVPCREISSTLRRYRANRRARRGFSSRICRSGRSILPSSLRSRDPRARPCTRLPNLSLFHFKVELHVRVRPAARAKLSKTGLINERETKLRSGQHVSIVIGSSLISSQKFNRIKRANVTKYRCKITGLQASAGVSKMNLFRIISLLLSARNTNVVCVHERKTIASTNATPERLLSGNTSSKWPPIFEQSSRFYIFAISSK